jgi:uncharacterized protein (UPF0276 family)
MQRLGLPDLGVGVGLRTTHYAHLLSQRPEVDWFEILGQRILLENPSTYAELATSTMSEAQFLASLADEADCGILLDVNNIYVSAFNHGFDAREYLAVLPYQRVGQVHVSGHTHHGTHLVDTHVGPVIDPVWGLWRDVHQRMQGVSVLLEWDTAIPEFEAVHREALRAREFMSPKPEALAPSSPEARS